MIRIPCQRRIPPVFAFLSLTGFFLFSGYVSPLQGESSVGTSAVSIRVVRSLERRLGPLAFVLLDARSGKLLDFYNPELAWKRTHPPGSLAKVWAAAGLLENGVSPGIQRECHGHYTFPRSDEDLSSSFPGTATIHYPCWKPGGHGRISLRSALVHSCNVFFLKSVPGNPGEFFQTMVRLWHLDRGTGFRGFSTDVDLSAVSRVPPDPIRARLAVLGEGGTLQLTLLKVAQLYGALYAGTPFLSPFRGNLPPLQIAPFSLRRENREFLLSALGGVIREGTLHRALNLDFSPLILEGGKTGSATRPGERYATHGWNVILFQKSGRKLVLVTFVDRGTGADEAARLSASLLEAWR